MENLDEINSINDPEDFDQIEGFSPINEIESFSYSETPGSTINLDSIEKTESVDNSIISTSDLSMENETVSEVGSNAGSINDKESVINNSETIYNEFIYNDSQISNLTSLGDAITNSSSNIINELNSSIDNISTENTDMLSQNSNLDVIFNSNELNESIFNESKVNTLDTQLTTISDVINNQSSNVSDTVNSLSNKLETVNSQFLNKIMDSSFISNNSQSTSETNSTEVSKNNFNVNKEVFPINIDNSKIVNTESNTTNDSIDKIDQPAPMSQGDSNTTTIVNNDNKVNEESNKKDKSPINVNVDMGAVVSQLNKIERLLTSTLDVRIKT